jgi:hypothetical protein
VEKRVWDAGARSFDYVLNRLAEAMRNSERILRQARATNHVATNKINLFTIGRSGIQLI